MHRAYSLIAPFGCNLMYYSENFAIDKHFYKKLAAYHYTRAKTFLPLRIRNNHCSGA